MTETSGVLMPLFTFAAALSIIAAFAWVMKKIAQS
jgi:hypothetical protein